MLLTLQNYSLRVVHKPGPAMFISNTLSRATAAVRMPSAELERHTICSTQQEQYDVEQSNRAYDLNITDRCLLQIRWHTDRDEYLQALKAVLTG